MQSYFWSVDVYNQDMLSNEAMALLSANRDVVRKSNTEGYMALQFVNKFNGLSPADREKVMKPSELSAWLNNIFGLDIKHTARILVLLCHDAFHKAVLQYCSTRYRERVFAWSTMQNIISSKLDKVCSSTLH